MTTHKQFMAGLAAAAMGLGIACLPLIAQSAVSSADADFAASAAEANNGEIALAKMALQKTNEPSVRMLASRMIADHTKAGNQLAAIAQTEQIKLPAPSALMQPDADMQKTLSGLNSHPFDTTYVNSQITDHQAAIALFQKEAQDGTDPALKQFAASTLPTLQAHLRLAQQAQQQVAPQ